MTVPFMKIVVVGLNHKTAPIQVRERLSFGAQEVSDALAQLQTGFPEVEFVLLSTCNRVEIYSVSDREGWESGQELVSALATLRGVDPDEFGAHTYVHAGLDAVRHLYKVTASLDSLVLGENQINIRALSLADTSDFGILRLIVNKPEETVRILRDGGFTVRENDVIAVEVDDRPGGLARILKLFSGAGISVEYMYAFVERHSGNAVMIFRVESVPGAAAALREAGIALLSNEQVCSL